MTRGNRNRRQANKNEKINKTTTNSNQIRETKNDQKSIVEKSNTKKMTSDSLPRAEKKPHWTELEFLDFSDVGGDDSLEQENQETTNDQITILENSNAKKMTSDSPPRAEKEPTEPGLYDLTNIGSDDSIDMAELMKQLDTDGVAELKFDFTKDDGDLDISSELRLETEDNSRKRTSRLSETETPDCEKKLKMDTNQPAEDEQDNHEENMEIIHDDG